MVSRVIGAIRERARRIKQDTFALYLAVQDPRTPWYAKALAGAVVAYAVSPIDLIPDFIPVLGYLDDLILVPLGMLLAIRLIPPSVMADCRAQARASLDRPTSKAAAFIIVAIWALAAALIAVLILPWLEVI